MILVASFSKIHYTSFLIATSKSVTSSSGVGKSLLCLLCRVISQIPLQRLVGDMLTC